MMDGDYDDLIFESASWMEDEKLLSKIDEDLDYALAFSLQEELHEQDSLSTVKRKVVPDKKSASNPLSLVDPQWELMDPHPNIQAMFLEFDSQYFYRKLGSVEVKWSKNMTLCAGVCSYEGRGGLCSIRLSAPLLKLRPRRDLVETLLHEMIHAYLFVTANNKDRQDHGPEFLSHMYRLNKETGTNISVYHSFHDEVDYYRKHWWKCDGPCQSRSPFFGIVKRAMNRAPSQRDPWWPQHQSSCGGAFHKVKEPEGYKQKTQKRKIPSEPKSHKSTPSIKNFFGATTSTSSTATKRPKGSVTTIQQIFAKEDNVVSRDASDAIQPSPISDKNVTTVTPFAGQGFTLGSSAAGAPTSYLSKIRKELVGERAKVQRTDKTPKSGPQIRKPARAKKGFPTAAKVTPTKGVQSSIKDLLSGTSTFPVGYKAEVSSSSLPVGASHNEHASEASSCKTVPCPVCLIPFPERDINSHLDECLLKNF